MLILPILCQRTTGLSRQEQSLSSSSVAIGSTSIFPINPTHKAKVTKSWYFHRSPLAHISLTYHHHSGNQGVGKRDGGDEPVSSLKTIICTIGCIHNSCNPISGVRYSVRQLLDRRRYLRYKRAIRDPLLSKWPEFLWRPKPAEDKVKRTEGPPARSWTRELKRADF